jgi:hypothetical protein
MRGIAHDLERARRAAASRPLRAWAVLSLAVAAVLGAGVWGLSVSRGGRGGEPAAVGDAVAVSGGTLRVLRVADQAIDTSMPMSGPGMSMSTPGAALPDTPAGFRRVAIELLLAADEGAAIRLESRDFRVTTTRSGVLAPIAERSRTTFVAPGTAVSRSLVFQVPAESKTLTLSVRDGERPIVLNLRAGRRERPGHSH